MQESLVLVLVGVVLGAGIAVVAGHFVASLLFDLPATDVASLVGAMAVMVSVAAIAGYLPARRASLVDPLAALRCE